MMKSVMYVGKLLAMFFAIWVMTGCATVAITGKADVAKSAFGAKKKFAVVSIASMKTFQGEKGMLNMFKSMDTIPGANTQPIIDKLKPVVFNTFGKTNNFYLLPEKSVLSSGAYKNLAEDAHVQKVMFMNFDMNEASHYKYISDEKKFAQLAKDMGVDGVISLTLNFTVAQGKSAFSINGISFGKKNYSAMTSVAVVAYDKDGKVVWKDSTLKEAEPGDTKAIIVLDMSDMSGVSFEKFHPSALEMAEKGLQVLYARLDDTLSGKGVSSFQSVK